MKIVASCWLSIVIVLVMHGNPNVKKIAHCVFYLFKWHLNTFQYTFLTKTQQNTGHKEVPSSRQGKPNEVATAGVGLTT